MRGWVIVSALVLTAGCTPLAHHYTGVARSNAGLASHLSEADEVIIGKLIESDFNDPGTDRHLTSSLWLIERSLKGNLLPNSTIKIRLPFGRDKAGNWLEPNRDGQSRVAAANAGDRFLLLLSRTAYERETASRGGIPYPGATGASLGMFPIVNGEIRAGDMLRTSADRAALDALLKGVASE